ncbi:MAG: hypothetical protein A2351_03805 [Omnitrophica bacterium RIFOXYB12_FULL_50_7]|nr:MAG: hypothetical protein A2351_03805 [Omnitrophica bacterium RIFOXYB12_FULL_50_7]
MFNFFSNLLQGDKIQDPITKNQAIFNDQNSKRLSRAAFRFLDIGILEFVWILVFGSWNF